MITENQLEQLAIQWFQDTGGKYANGAGLASEGAVPDRLYFRAVVLKARFAADVQRFDPKLPPAAVGKIAYVVTTPAETSLPLNNRAFHRLLMDVVKVDLPTRRARRNRRRYDEGMAEAGH